MVVNVLWLARTWKRSGRLDQTELLAALRGFVNVIENLAAQRARDAQPVVLALQAYMGFRTAPRRATFRAEKMVIAEDTPHKR
jgi:hypothetical protein